MTIKLNLRIVVGVVTALALLFVVAYFGSPYMAARSFVDAAKSGNRDRIEAAVDFPRVRDSLKSQMAAMMATKLKSDPSMANNPFAGLAMLMVPALIDKAVDMYVTPDGMSALVQQRDPTAATGSTSAQTAQSPQTAQTKTSTSWITFDRFRATALGADRDKDVSLIFERRGLFGWRVIRLELPQGLMNTPSAPASETTMTTTTTPDATATPPAVTPVEPPSENATAETTTTTTEENTTSTSNSTTPGL